MARRKVTESSHRGAGEKVQGQGRCRQILCLPGEQVLRPKGRGQSQCGVLLCKVGGQTRAVGALSSTEDAHSLGQGHRTFVRTRRVRLILSLVRMWE